MGHPCRTSAPTWPLAATYAGAVIDAGFATGQELVRFSVTFGPRSLPGLAVATFLLSAAGGERSAAAAHSRSPSGCQLFRYVADLSGRAL